MGRRSTGTVEARQSSIRLKFTHLGVRQLEMLDLKPTPANIKAAERLLARIQGALVAGLYRRSDFFDTPGRIAAIPTFREYAATYLETLTRTRGTRRQYEKSLRLVWSAAFGDEPITQVRQSDVKKAMAKRLTTVGNKTMNGDLCSLRGVFAMAIADELIARDPCEGVTNQPTQASEPDPFEAHERDAILEHMRIKFHDAIWNYFTISFHTGLRPSEQIMLKWGDVDWARRKLRISRARVEREEKTTKTNKVRYVDLSDVAMAALKRQKVHTFMKDPTGFIFHNPRTGKAWPDEKLQRETFFVPTLVVLKLRHRDCYQCRHTFATVLLMGGVNPVWISKQLGHTNTRMLFEVYTKWIDGADRGAEAAKANQVLSGIVPELSPAKTV